MIRHQFIRLRSWLILFLLCTLQHWVTLLHASHSPPEDCGAYGPRFAGFSTSSPAEGGRERGRAAQCLPPAGGRDAAVSVALPGT
ncbi:hypothetical protein [Streptomyces aureocirculatus]|uniref:hypothetical protein n=1 Tax=Streptomyces aureocirculatus TaxID=67275 RepID=UPI0004CAE565|nr:hypothetical protein [Streptomyces aureocirculatus]